MNLQPLVTELAKPEYASLTDQEAADVINAKTITVRKLVDTYVIKRYAIEHGIWPKIVLVREDTKELDLILRGLCISVVSWIDDPNIQTIDIDLPKVQEMLGGLILYNIATETEIQEINAMASVTVPWTTHNGIGEVGIGYIRAARGM